jgi:arylsulfatase
VPEVRRGRRHRGRGRHHGGCSLYAKNGKPKYCYNFFGLQETTVEGASAFLRPHQVRMEFAYDGGGIAKGGTVSLFVDGKKTARADRADRTVRVWRGDLDVGHEGGSPVTTDYHTTGARILRTGELGGVRRRRRSGRSTIT